MKIIERQTKVKTNVLMQKKMKPKIRAFKKLIKYMKRQEIILDFLSQPTVTQQDIAMIQKVEHVTDVTGMVISFYSLFNESPSRVQNELNRVYNKMRFYVSTKTNVSKFLNEVHPMFELYGHSGKNKQLIVTNKMCVYDNCIEDWLLDPKIDVHKLQKIVSKLEVV